MGPIHPREAQRQLGEQIRLLRQRRGMTQARLAEACGVSPEYVTMLEHGKVSEGSPSFSVLVRLADSLDVSLAELVGEAPSDNRVPYADEIVRLLRGLDERESRLVYDITRRIVRDQAPPKPTVLGERPASYKPRKRRRS